MKLKTAIESINIDFSPLAWTRVKLRMAPFIRARGYDLSSFSEEIELDKEMITAIDSSLKEVYGTGLKLR